MPKAAFASMAALAVILSVAGCGSPGDNRSGLTGSPAPAAPVTSTPSGPSTSSQSTSSPSASSDAGSAPNDADVLFAQVMIPDQKQAIEMSAMMAAKAGVDPRVSDLAKKIADERTSENTRMSGWLTSWGASATPSLDMRHDRVGNMVSKADIQKLKQASGTRSATLFLDDMIEHHQSAIGIAQAELDDGQNPDAEQLARDDIANQQAEINTMTRLRAVL